MSKGPPFIPPGIQSIKQTCPSCGKEVRPGFWKEFQDPFIPVYPEGTQGEKGAWVQLSVIVPCACGEKLNFDLNYKKLSHPVFFYGDDADRSIGKWHMHSYSLIGGTSGPIRDMSNELVALKSKYVPTYEPSGWRIHATKMLNGRERISNQVYKNFSKESVIDFFKDCAKILKRFAEYTWNMHITAIIISGTHKKERNKLANHVKIVAHQALISYCIYLTTHQEVRPIFTFDASKPVKKYPHIESWSYDSHLASRNYLAYAFISHSNDITAPTFVSPGSHPCLELADVHAFFAANSMFRRARGETPEINLADFGKFRYITVNSESRFEHTISDDIPSSYYPSKIA